MLAAHFIADTDTDDFWGRINFSLQMQTQLFFAASRGAAWQIEIVLDPISPYPLNLGGGNFTP